MAYLIRITKPGDNDMIILCECNTEELAYQHLEDEAANIFVHRLPLKGWPRGFQTDTELYPT